MRYITPLYRAPFATLRRSVPSRRASVLRRDGFTLIELLVVISIILLVGAITLSAVNLSITGDRIRGAARQVQSYLEGARSRAVYGGNASSKGAGYQCGVRFIRESTNPSDPRFNLCSSIQFVEVDPTNAAITGGVYGIQYDAGGLPTRLVGTINHPVEEANTHWISAYQQGLIFEWQVILLNNRKYQIDTAQLAAGNEVIDLKTAYIGTMPFAAPGDTNGFAVPKGREPPFKILLPPQPMANQEVRSLGNGVVFDLRISKGLNYYINQGLPIDVMFSPRGMVIGPISGSGIVEFVLSDREDSINQKNLPSNSDKNPVTKRERMIVSLTPLTGKTAVHPVYIGQASEDADPFRYAETGEVARQ